MRCIVFAVFLVLQGCHSRSLEEESVVSDYTQNNTEISGPFGVYHQIANNLAERITSPIYRFLGIAPNKTHEATTKRPWDKIEILDEPEAATQADLKPVNNDISLDRDVEELSAEALTRAEKKPEKITLFSSYLPTNERLSNDTGRNYTGNDIGNDAGNDTGNELDEDPFEFNDVDEEETPREGGFTYFLEIIGSIVQLAWGALVAFFRPNNNNNSS